MLQYVLLGYLVMLSVYDIRFRSIPLWGLAIGGIGASLNIVYTFAGCESGIWYAVQNVIVAMVPGAFMLLAGRISGKVGCGDGFVLLITGSVLAWNKLFVVYAVSLLMAALIAIVLMAMRKLKREDKLPYLPFLALAVLLVQ